MNFLCWLLMYFQTCTGTADTQPNKEIFVLSLSFSYLLSVSRLFFVTFRGAFTKTEIKKMFLLFFLILPYTCNIFNSFAKIIINTFMLGHGCFTTIITLAEKLVYYMFLHQNKNNGIYLTSQQRISKTSNNQNRHFFIILYYLFSFHMIPSLSLQLQKTPTGQCLRQGYSSCGHQNYQLQRPEELVPEAKTNIPVCSFTYKHTRPCCLAQCKQLASEYTPLR